MTAVGDRLAAWVSPAAEAVGAAIPAMPGGLNDRAEDVWEALLAVADQAGGDWPERARAAAVALSGAAEENADTSLGIRLLADLRKVFADADALHGATILTELHKIDEAPWGDYYGRPLNARDMAKLLKPYGLRSVDVKIDGTNLKGYRRDQLYDPWSRYPAAVPGGSATSATSATAQLSDLPEVAGSGSQALPATSPMPLTSKVAEVAQVADTPGAGGRMCAICGEREPGPGGIVCPECVAARPQGGRENERR